MIIKDYKYFAKMYFVLRRFPMNIRDTKLTNIQEETEKYCSRLLKESHIRNRVEYDMMREVITDIDSLSQEVVE
jgi:hypothetical protein